MYYKSHCYYYFFFPWMLQLSPDLNPLVFEESPCFLVLRCSSHCMHSLQNLELALFMRKNRNLKISLLRKSWWGSDPFSWYRNKPFSKLGVYADLNEHCRILFINFFFISYFYVSSAIIDPHLSLYLWFSFILESIIFHLF